MAKFFMDPGCPCPCRPTPLECQLFLDPGGADGTTPQSPWVLESGTWQYQANYIEATNAAAYVDVSSSPSISDFVTAILDWVTNGTVRIYVRRDYPIDTYVFGEFQYVSGGCSEISVGYRVLGIDTIVARRRVWLASPPGNATICYSDNAGNPYVTLTVALNLLTGYVPVQNGFYSGFTTSGTVGLRDFEFSRGSQPGAEECPACPTEPFSCVNGTGPGGSVAQFNCLYDVLSGVAPYLFTGFPLSAYQGGDGEHLLLATNSRGPTAYQKSQLDIQFKETGQKVRLYVCDNGTLSTGAWSEVECTNYISDTRTDVIYRVGVGGATLLETAETELSFTSVGSIKVCHNAEFVVFEDIIVPAFDGFSSAAFRNARMEAATSAIVGDYCGIIFSGITTNDLLWSGHSYSRIEAGAIDTDCGRCECTMLDENSQPVKVPCMFRQDWSGWVDGPNVDPSCAKVNGQHRCWLQGPLQVGGSGTTMWRGSYLKEKNDGSFVWVPYYLFLAYDYRDIDLGWWVYCHMGTPIVNLDLLYLHDSAYYKKSLGPVLSDIDFYSWFDEDIPVNNPGACNITGSSALVSANR